MRFTSRPRGIMAAQLAITPLCVCALLSADKHARTPSPINYLRITQFRRRAFKINCQFYHLSGTVAKRNFLLFYLVLNKCFNTIDALDYLHTKSIVNNHVPVGGVRAALRNIF